MKKGLVLLLAVFAVVPQVMGAAVSFTGGAGAADPNWSNGANWSSGLKPTSADDVTIGTGMNAAISKTGTVITAATDKTLTIDGGKLSMQLENTYQTLTGNTTIKNGGILDNGGFFRQAGLIVGTNSQVIVHDQALLISTAWWKFETGADLKMLGGEYRIPELNTYMNVSLYGNGKFCDKATGSIIDIHAGKINIQTDPTNPTKYFAEIQAKIADGSIVGYGGIGTVQVTYNFSDATLNPWKTQGYGVTTITAIPEPATIAILCLGGLFLRRRRS